MIKKEYEISLWKNELVPAGSREIDGETVEVPAHYEEAKTAVIGRHDMESPAKAFSPTLRENINGTHQLTFQMYYIVPEDTNYDVFGDFRRGGRIKEQEGEGSRDNPFAHLILPESKIKLFYEDKWYDFIVKEIVRDKTNKTLSFQCIDSYVNELSRTGYDILFDAELENNIGTAGELIEEVLEGTEYTFDHEGSDTIQEWLEEPVYEGFPTTAISARNDLNGSLESIPANKRILVYYPQMQTEVMDKGGSGSFTLQFGYKEDYEREPYSPLVLEVNPYRLEVNWVIEGDMVAFRPSGSSTVWLRLNLLEGVSIDYRAKRLVQKQRSKYDPLSMKYVDLYIANQDGDDFKKDDIIYRNIETVFTSPSTVDNLIVNGRNFTNTTGWSGEDIVFTMWPLFTKDTQSNLDNFQSDPYLRMDSGKTYYNKAVTTSSYLLEKGLQKGEDYIVRFKIKSGNATNPTGDYLSSGLTPSLRAYDDTGLYIKPASGGKTYATVTSLGRNGDWVEYKLKITESVPRVEIRGKRVGLFLSASRRIWLHEAQMFKLEYGKGASGNPVMLEPETLNAFSVEETLYSYYNHTEHAKKDRKEIKYLWNSTNDWTETRISPVYSSNFEKVRTLSIGESTRFNILQSIAELFEVWIDFDIPHKENGSLFYNKNGLPVKRVRLVKEKGQDSGLDFVHSIDLRGLKRTYQSNEISTKTIVKPNILALAGKDIVTIANARENYSRASYILDFDYYVMQDIINAGELVKDLYSPRLGVGLYEVLRRNYLAHQEASRVLGARKTELASINSTVETYEGLVHSTQDELHRTKESLVQIAGASSWSGAQSYIKQHADNLTIQAKVFAITELQNSLAHYQKVRDQAEQSKSYLEGAINVLEDRIVDLLEEAHSVEKTFHQKYSSFIQEGVWSDDNYIDDSLYYLDAKSVSVRSSRPQVAYEISVARMNILEDFKAKQFRVGDIARIQDPEFLGMKWVEGIKTPMKEKVLLSEALYYLDEPDKDVYTVQNYRTQFEDLFQRIVADVQQLQFSHDGAMASTNTLTRNLGSLAWGDLIERAMLGETIISGGFIQTEMIKIGNGSIFDPGYDPSTKETPGEAQAKAEREAYLAREDIASDLGYNGYDELAAKAGEGQTIIVGGYIDSRMLRISGDGIAPPGDKTYQQSTEEEREATAVNLGYGNYAQMIQAQSSGQTIIVGGYINTGLIKTGLIVGQTDKYSLNLNTGKVIMKDAELEGEVVATSGRIGGFDIKDYTLESSGGTYVRLSGQSGYVPLRIGPSSSNITFEVNTAGKMTATDADITGKITATSGEIGGWTIRNGYIDSTAPGVNPRFLIMSNEYEYNGTPATYHLRSTNSSGTVMFEVSKTGNLFARSADIAGKITATSGKIGNFELDNGRLRLIDTPNNLRVTLGGLSTTGNQLPIWVGPSDGSDGSFYVSSAHTYIKNHLNMEASASSTRRVLNAEGGEVKGSIDVIHPFNKSSNFVDILNIKTSYITATVVEPSVSNGFLGDSGSKRWAKLYIQAGGINEGSDLRLKSKINNIPDDLIKFIAEEVTPKTFTVNEQIHFGYIAQDVERALFKYSVRTVGFKNAKSYMETFNLLDKNESYLSLVYSQIAIIKEAEMQNKIQELKQRVAQLEEALNV